MKTTTKKPLPKIVRDIRLVLIGNVCPEWRKQIMRARTVAACRKLWEGAVDSARHTALLHTGLGGSFCLGCTMGSERRDALTFEEYVGLVTQKAAEIRARRAA